MPLTLFDVGGLVGVFILLMTYFMLQLGKVDSKHFSYSLLNFFGAFLIFCSLLFDWNLAAGLIEIFWMMISIIGIIKVKRLRLSERIEIIPAVSDRAIATDFQKTEQSCND